MKQNGNDKKTGEYYLGLDVGTNSVGWAVTDPEYRVLKFHGNAMWGARLFDEAQDASGRRSSRVARRRLARRNQRLHILEVLFAEEIGRVDHLFLRRMEESALWLDDKTDRSCRFSLFNDIDFTDKDYHRRYPTIYHLRQELMQSDEPHDIRLVYLALHHILKSRGHFLYASSGEDDQIIPVETVLAELQRTLEEAYSVSFSIADEKAFVSALARNDIGVGEKQKLLKAAWGGSDEDDAPVKLSSVIDLLAGKSGIKLSLLFADESLDAEEISKVSLKNDLDELFDSLSASLGDRVDLLLQLKDVYDTARLTQMLKGHATLSEAKIALYEKNRADLRLFKAWVRRKLPKHYKEIFSLKKDKLNNYAAYSGYQSKSGSYSCTQEAFCKYLNSLIPAHEQGEGEMARIFREIREGSFLQKLKGSDNGVIPFQLQRQELNRILDRCEAYLPFLNTKDEDGFTVSDKIRMTFEFRIPYYVGPLNSKAGAYWAVRFPGTEKTTITPWNFRDVIDTEASARAFMFNLVGRCSYTGERVLPRDSLLYSEFMLLNELNPLRVNGTPISPEVKQRLVRDLFMASRKPVTKKQIRNYLLSEGLIEARDEISGIDDRIKSTLRSYHDFRLLLEKTGDTDLVEQIIEHVLIFGEDRRMLRSWLKKIAPMLDDEELSRICRLKYREWGRLSKVFLTGLYDADPETGEARNIMDLLRSSNENLMQLLSTRYSFAEQAEEHRKELFGCGESLDARMESLYLAPAVRRSVRQTLRIVDEIVDIRKSVPRKIFVEMARDSAKDLKGKRTESRKAKLLALYASCREESAALLPRLQEEDEGRLRSDKLYLYYSQFGKCMYSGEPIDLEALMDGSLFDVDHIFPQSRIKDNSLDNRVVVKNTLNREKTNSYPIKAEIRSQMRPFWEMLRQNGMISQKKYDRLIRQTPLTEQELSSFVARQLVETQQSTKALTVLLKERYGDAVRVVFSKAGNVSDFRRDFDLLKCREVNDLHHAKDAYLNIVVGNVYCTRFTDRFFANIENENYSLNRVFDFDVPGAWDRRETIRTVKSVMVKNNPIVTRMPREVKGQLFDLQLMPAGKGQLPRKEGMDIDRYGGYNKLTGSYYFAVEHTEKKKRVCTIEPVYLYCQNLYEKEPLRYCTEILQLQDPRIICAEIRADALLEIDGSRLYISGCTGSYYVCEHAFQLAIDSERERYIRNIAKYAERCASRRTELPITEYDGISAEKNADLYAFFLSKLGTSVYQKILSNMKKDLEANQQSFLEKSLYEQVLLLLEILKPFRCNAQYANLSALNGKGTVGRVLIQKKLNNAMSASLIHQSVTGLFECREDLLK